MTHDSHDSPDGRGGARLSKAKERSGIADGHGREARAPARRPLEVERYAWPSAELDPVQRMRALAAGLPHVAVDETIFDAPFDRVWSFIADLEQSIPRFESSVTHLEILETRGDRLRLRTRTPIGFPIHFDAVLRSGWCLMESSRTRIGMAARSEGPGRTRFIHFEGSSRLGRWTRPYLRWNIRQDFRRLRALFAARTG